MADTEWGERDSRGEWQPGVLPEPSPLFSWPPRVRKVLGYLFAPQGFLWPINLVVSLLAVFIWYVFTPSLDRAASFRFGWIAEIYLRNVVTLIVVAGGLHLALYIKKSQGLKFKYSNKWLAKKDPRFLFGNQTLDNIFWNLTSGALIWTAWEALTLWMYANDMVPFTMFRSRPVYFILLMIAVPFWRQFHFYWVHRLIHWKPLFKASHYLHHKNINIGPWSGLTMHPLEHLIYFSGVALFWIIPSHPIHAMLYLFGNGATPALGHVGFHRLVGKGDTGLKTEFYFHYLHHRYFTVNFGDESVPLDKWFGSHHDGSPESHEAMLARRKTKEA